MEMLATVGVPVEISGDVSECTWVRVALAIEGAWVEILTDVSSTLTSLSSASGADARGLKPSIG